MNGLIRRAEARLLLGSSRVHFDSARWHTPIELRLVAHILLGLTPHALPRLVPTLPRLPIQLKTDLLPLPPLPEKQAVAARLASFAR